VAEFSDFLAATQLPQDRPRAEADHPLFHISVYLCTCQTDVCMRRNRIVLGGGCSSVSFPQYNGERVVEDQEGAP
jgi:hypothetical protein